jgi:uncharacterized RmlC-like cupin family protein
MYCNPGLTFDSVSFDPMRIMPVKHRLMEHPLLQLHNLVELAQRLATRGLVRAHNDQARPETSFSSTPDTHPIQLPVAESIRRIEESNTWMALHNVQTDPLYCGLVDEVLDCVGPLVDAKDPGLCHRAGWIFVTSPNAITPYHLDHEHNFILQIRGDKTIHVFDPLDRAITSELALERFHHKHSRELVTLSPGTRTRAHVFEASPGDGVYMPTTAPHWVKNGNNVSVTVSFTYYTTYTMRLKQLYRANATLRTLGIEPRKVGKSPNRDILKHALYSASEALRRKLGRRELDPTLSMARYAPL